MSTRHTAHGTRHTGVFLCAVCCVLCLVPSSGAQTVNRIAAIVNDEVITEADVGSQVDTLLHGPRSEGEEPPDPVQLKQMMLQRLIEHRLILQEAKRAKVSVSPEDIEKRVEALSHRYDSEETWEQAMAASGVSPEQLKERVREDLLIKRVIETQVRATITVSPQEVAQRLSAQPELVKPGDRTRVSHLLIRITDNRSEDAARAQIQDIRRQLLHGADFSTIAQRSSEDSHAKDGGAMGWVAHGELLPELDQALVRLNVGELSEPIKTSLGFHLLKVEERRPAAVLSAMEANQAVFERLYQEKFQAAFGRWLGDLKQRAYIDIPDLSAERSVSDQ